MGMPVRVAGSTVIALLLVLASVPETVDLRAVIEQVRVTVAVAGCAAPIVEVTRLPGEPMEVRGWCRETEEHGDRGLYP